MIRSAPTARAALHAGRLPDALGWRARGLAPASWAALGFLAGVVFWHLVGFWGFVTEAIFNGDAPVTAAVEVQTPAPAPVRGATPRRTVAIEPACSALILNRQSAETRTGPCPPARFQIRNGSLALKQDRAPVPAMSRTVSIDADTSLMDWETQLGDSGANLSLR